MNQDEILGILHKHDGDGGGLISILEDIQAKYRYLPADAMRIVADETGRSLVDVYGVATFYKSFSLKPRGEHIINVCMGTACHVRGSRLVLEEMERQVGVKAGGTTEDLEYTLETVNCVGACALGPVVIGDGTYFGKLKLARIPKVLKAVKED